MPPSNEPPAAAPASWGAWLHALWGHRAQLVPLATPPEAIDAARPILTGHCDGERVLHLPLQAGRATDRQWGIAAAAHAAAHWRFGGPPQPRAGLKPVQLALLAVLEDARVEALAMAQLPGLRALWLPHHSGGDAPQGTGFEALLSRVARALLDPRTSDPHPWVRRVRAAFFDAGHGDLSAHTPEAVRALASRLGNEAGQMRLPFNPGSYGVHPAYRDDNSWMWLPDEAPASDTRLGADRNPAVEPGQHVPSADDAPRPLGPEAPLRLYPEWDARIGRYRRDWCGVRERLAGGPAVRAALPLPHAGLERQLRQGLAKLCHGPRQARGRAPWGDEFDSMALVDVLVRRNAGQPPAPDIYRRIVMPHSPLAVLLLVDASLSTGQAPVGGSALLDDLLAVALATAQALEWAGHCAEVMSFCSHGRQRVEVGILKGWDEAADARSVIERCLAQRAAGSTRMGAALRHAAASARSRAAPAARRPMVLMLSDGAPHDIDEADPRYLPGDLKRAVGEAQRSGVGVRALLVESEQGQVDGRLAQRSFGPGAWAVMKDLRTLPALVGRLLQAVP